MSAPELLVRADGGPGVGVGHLARCLALTQAWVDWGGRATLVSSSPPPAWTDRYRREGVTVCEPIPALEGDADWAVLDGYRFGEEDEEKVRKAARRLLVIDDHGAGGDHGADLLVDQNLDAAADPDQAETLLGTNYALLRREFRPWQFWTRDTSERARKLLVALGGSPSRQVRSLVRSVLADPSLRDLTVTFLEDMEDVTGAMADADVALSASGSTCWELCCMGLPAVLIPTAPNQVPVAEAMHSHGVADNAGPPSSIDPASLATTVAGLARDPGRRAEMARRGQQLVDGRGALRVVSRMRSHLLQLRPAREEDARLLWEWVNEPAVRAAAFNSEPISWDGHLRWLAGRLSDPGTNLYLASCPDGTPLGQVRFEGDATEAEISISVASTRRGCGWGAALIDAAVQRLFDETSVQRVIARIKSENWKSRSAFEAAAFVRDTAATGEGIRYVRQRMGR